MRATIRPLVPGLALALAACGGGDQTAPRAVTEREAGSSSFVDLFRSTDESRELSVNKYLWTASLDVLSFLPLEAADPFSGIISTGWGRPSAGAPAYRSTVYISSPALEARSLRVAVFRQSGGGAVAVSDGVAEQIEDAILTRARQLQVGADDRR